MKKKQFDAQTAKKIINDYAEKINLLSRENNVLKKQLEDSKISLQINKEILYSHIKSKKNVNDECDSIIADLKKENERLNNKITWLFTEKAELAKKLYKLEDSLNDKINQETIKNEKEKTEKFLYENKLKEKESQIYNLKRQLENYKRNFKNNYNEVKEIYIGDPDKFNTEMNNELKMSREIIKKYIYFIQSQRENTRKLNNQIQDLKEQISSQKANSSFITPTPKFINSNNPQLALLSEIFNHKKEEEGNDINNNNLSESSDSDNDKENIDLSFIKNKNIKENKDNKESQRNKTVEKVSKIPKLNFRKVEEKYKEPLNIKCIEYQNMNGDNEEINNGGNNSILEQRYKSQIEIYKKSIEKYKEKVSELRKQIRKLIDKNTLLENTLKIYFNNNMNKNQNKNDNDISMTPCVNDASGISTNSIIFKGGTLENINKLNEINKKIRLNKIMNTQDDNTGYNKDNNEDVNENIKKEDPLDNIIINDNYYKTHSKEVDKITTKDSSKN
jgi:hypothetical protein